MFAARTLAFLLVIFAFVNAHAQDQEEKRAMYIQNLYGEYSILHLTVEGSLDGALQNPETVGIGTGFIVSSNGHVLTAAHLFGKTPERYKSYSIKARLGSSTTNAVEKAVVVKIDRQLDLALLKLPKAGTGSIAMKWYRVPIGDPRLVVDGAPIVALGFPEELETYQRARGYITDLNGPKGWMQINAVVSKGYSGGPVFNEYGEAIGVVTAGYVNPALKYAIPISYASGMLHLTGP